MNNSQNGAMENKNLSGTEAEEPSSRTSHEPDAAFKEYILEVLEDTKAQDIATIELKGKSPMADYMIIASGTSTRHVSHIAEEVRDKVKEKFSINSKIEGAESGDWVVVDTLDAVVHVFRPEVREFYNLEKLWASDFDDTSFTMYSK